MQDNISGTEASAAIQAEPVPGMAEIFKELLFYVKPETNLLILGGRTLFFLVIFFWGLKFIFMPMASSDVFDSIGMKINFNPQKKITRKNRARPPKIKRLGSGLT